MSEAGEEREVEEEPVRDHGRGVSPAHWPNITASDWGREGGCRRRIITLGVFTGGRLGGS